MLIALVYLSLSQNYGPGQIEDPIQISTVTKYSFIDCFFYNFQDTAIVFQKEAFSQYEFDMSYCLFDSINSPNNGGSFRCESKTVCNLTFVAISNCVAAKGAAIHLYTESVISQKCSFNYYSIFDANGSIPCYIQSFGSSPDQRINIEMEFTNASHCTNRDSNWLMHIKHTISELKYFTIQNNNIEGLILLEDGRTPTSSNTKVEKTGNVQQCNFFGNIVYNYWIFTFNGQECIIKDSVFYDNTGYTICIRAGILNIVNCFNNREEIDSISPGKYGTISKSNVNSEGKPTFYEFQYYATGNCLAKDPFQTPTKVPDPPSEEDSEYSSSEDAETSSEQIEISSSEDIDLTSSNEIEIISSEENKFSSSDDIELTSSDEIDKYSSESTTEHEISSSDEQKAENESNTYSELSSEGKTDENDNDEEHADATNADNDDENGLGTSLYIIIGCVVGVIIIVCLVVLIIVYRKKQNESQNSSSEIEIDEEEFPLTIKEDLPSTIQLFTSTVLEDSDPFANDFEENC